MKSSSVPKRKHSNNESPYDYCGTCLEALVRPKFPLHSHSHLSNSVISCANWKKKCCKALTHGSSSPHHHLGCVSRTIPIDSVLYSSIIHYSELQHSEDQHCINDVKDVDAGKTTANEPGRNSSSVASTVSYGSHSSVAASINSGRKSKSKTRNPFLCDYCNVQGSAQYLLEYFSNFRRMKIQYYDDNEAVDSIPPVVNVDDSNLKNEFDEGLTLESGFITHLKNQYKCDTLQKRSEVTIENIRRIHENISSGSSSSPEHHSISPNYLLGQPLRLYCNITRSYHCGRIIDSRIIDSSFHQRLKPKSKATLNSRSGCISDASIKDYISLDQSLGRTQYLVRFRAGLDGRKVALHQWLFLEEHPILVGVATVWAKAPKIISAQEFQGFEDVSSKQSEQSERRHKCIFSPAKIFVRTMIERNRPNRKDASENSEDDVFVVFYDREDKHVHLKLTKEESDSCTEMLGAYGNSKQFTKETILYESFDEIVAADWNEPPAKVKLYLQTMRACDESFVENIAAALVDEEEKQRIIEDHAFT